MKKAAFLLSALLLLAPFISRGQADKPGAGEGKRTAPYFAVKTEGGVDGFPLLKTEAKVDIAGVVANVELTQVYKNSGDKTIEAIYVFPLGTRSAIHAMTMIIGDRTIEAEIHETEQARKIYEDAKSEGKVTSLLEQKRPNVFKMNVANIMPGDVINVTVKYTELLVPDQGVYEYMFPTVVGPRFTGEDTEENLEGDDNWTATPYRHEGEDPSYAFNIEVNLDAGIPITKLDVPTHKVNTKKRKSTATIKLAPEERKGGNRDFILRYSLQGGKIQSGLLLYPGEDENFFLLLMEPPEKISPDMIPPREYLFIVDVSGSMHGFPLDTSKKLISNMLGGLRNKDYFNILFFSGGANVLSDKPLQANKENIDKAMNMLASQRGGGGTRLLNALETACKLEKKKGMSRTVIAVTDGYVSVEKRTFDYIRDNMNDANFFAFGIGSSVNRYIIEGMARVGNGEPFVVINGQEAEETATRFMKYVQHPLLTDIEVSFDGFDAYDIEPPNVPDLFSERPIVLFGKYKTAEGRITVTGMTTDGKFKKQFTVKSGLENKSNTALQYLWARKRLELLSDYARVGVDNKDEIIAIGLKYHLMTRYTSFVAVDTVVRDTGETVTVKQPLPLPEGVSDLAVEGGRMLSLASLPMMGSVAHVDKLEEDTSDGVSKDGENAEVSLVGGTFPKGTSLSDAEKIVVDKIGDELKGKFKEWELTRLTVVLDVKAGKVTDVKFTGYKGKTCDEEALTKIFKKLKFDSGITGSMTLILSYR